jgi:hypothetical protein
VEVLSSHYKEWAMCFRAMTGLSGTHMAAHILLALPQKQASLN